MGGFFYIKELYGMRLDKFLKVSRLIKRRTVANEACSAGRVTVNGKTAKAGTDVKPGDEIRIRKKRPGGRIIQIHLMFFT